MSNAALQQIIMTHIINHHWLGDMFDWSSEGRWSKSKGFWLSSSQHSSTFQPQPDAIVSFTLQSVSEKNLFAPIPVDLLQCISPEATPSKRYFPFLFMEFTDLGAAGLQKAYRANRLIASQALYNIYSWMVFANLEDSFFSTIRVFSFVFNTQDFVVHVHRAAKVLSAAGWDPGFQFDDLYTFARYTNDQACLLVQSTLRDYAAQELHPILKIAFEEIMRQE